MMKIKLLITAFLFSIFGSFNAHAVVVDVFAKANSSTGGYGAITGLNVSIGDRLVVNADVNDCWSAGASPRTSNADGLNGGPFCEPNGAFPQWTQAGVTANYGTLMGKIGALNFFAIGTAFDQVMAEAGNLLLYYWDSNAGDNSGSVQVTARLIPGQGTQLPEPGIIGMVIMGFGLLLYRKRRA